MIHTTGWTREKVRTSADYQRWLELLRDGDEVLLQQFHPAAGQNAVLSSLFEVWQFERVRVLGSQLISRGNSRPVNRETGCAVCWNSDKEWGNVFPARVVPCHHDLPAEAIGDSVWGHMPVYEPLFLGCYRHHIFCPYGDESRRVRWGFERDKRHYSREVERGLLLVVFTDDDELAVPAPLRYLYAEYIER